MNASKSMFSIAFEAFGREASKHAEAWSRMIQETAAASALDEKTRALAYIGVLAAIRSDNGIESHVMNARKAGATRKEIISAILVGLPAAGHSVMQVLPTALSAYDTAIS
jgi:alkylhydroperoxidase/carboxymuconolactone decarboxylase family protein YurZ